MLFMKIYTVKNCVQNFREFIVMKIYINRKNIHTSKKLCAKFSRNFINKLFVCVSLNIGNTQIGVDIKDTCNAKSMFITMHSMADYFHN